MAIRDQRVLLPRNEPGRHWTFWEIVARMDNRPPEDVENILRAMITCGEIRTSPGGNVIRVKTQKKERNV